MNKEVELKPCPCCGGKAIRRQRREDWKVKCIECGLSILGWGEEIDKWNKRVPLPQPTQEYHWTMK